MSLLYIVDGYNLLNRSPFIKDNDLESGRKALLSHIEGGRPQGSLKNGLVVVFDGVREVFGPAPSETRSFDVVFTRGETADEKIVSLVRDATRPKSIVVVTDDKALARAVRGLGAKTMATGEFLSKGRRVRGRRGPEEKTDLNIVQREAITEELRGLWLKKRSS